MLISNEFFNQLSPSYQKVIKEFEDELVKIQSESPLAYTDRVVQEQIIGNFFGNYLMPKEYWQFYESLFEESHVGMEYETQREKRKWKAFQHFYFDNNFGAIKNLQKNDYFHPKLLEYSGPQESGEPIGSVDETNFSYPHSFLKECFQFYESQASTPPSKALILQCEKMKQLYQKIKASEGNLEVWFKNLLETDDNEFVYHNVEHRLGENLLDKKLWKLYLNFLETTDIKRTLEVYSKYCRFFLDDLEMKEEYKEKVEKFGPSFVHWNNEFDFETRAEKIENSSFEYPQVFHDMGEDETPVPLSVDKNVLKNFYKSYQSQTFPFQKPFIEYILVNANSFVWRKLYQTCKYFFARKPVPICYRLQIKLGASAFKQESLDLKFDNNETDNYLKNTWITTSLFCKFYQNIPNTFISTIIPRLYKCDVKYITIWNQILTFNEMKFLIGSGNVIKLNLPSVRIRDANDEFVNLENIMDYLPNAEQIQLSNVKVNKNTATILAKQNFHSKINYIKLLDIFGDPFDTSEFLHFCQKNRDEHFFLRMEFKPRRSGFSHEFITNFEQFMKNSVDLKTTHIEINFTPM